MEAEENRPSTARRDSRKVPGGFTIDDEDDLSPTKRSFFEDSSWSEANAKAHTTNTQQIPTLDATKLPPLPPADSSILSAQTQESSEGHLDSLDERAMRKHLMDVESSFMPAPSPIGPAVNPGVDDTFLFDGAPKPTHASPEAGQLGQTSSKTATAEDADTDDSAFSPPVPGTSYHTPHLPQNGFSDGPSNASLLDNGGNTTSSLETMSSSPTAAAAARTVSRAVSLASMGGYETANDTTEDHDDSEKDEELTPKKNRRKESTQDDSSDERSTIRNQDSLRSLNSLAADAGHTPGVGLLHRRSEGRRPKFLRSRNASQRSSVSSFTTNTDSHDDNGGLGADYALQSGGALPTDGQSRASSYMLSRTISLGSMASGIDESSEGRFPDRALATLDEEERNRGRRTNSAGKDSEGSPPATPRAGSQTLAAPTDTVIAQHVRNVQVPESLAREYRSKTGITTPGRLSGLSVPSTIGRNGKNMTLKEQSSTIERLSKENFDLKLKVMFLSDRLDKVSEEGVKEMISENVDLKTTLANVQRDSKGLRRKVKELEQKLKEGEDRPQTATSGGASDETRSPGSFDHDAHEREEELIYLRERVDEYTTEIEKLRNESLNREAEKRKLADVVRAMSEKRSDNLEAREEMDVWKDLLEQETARREEADDENQKLRDEIFRLKSEAAIPGGNPGLNHTTNIYLSKKRQLSPTRPRSRMSEQPDDRTGTISVASTLVDELRKESEQLRHENAELRREVGAQTSMLTSRNREKERLYQEIEDLKLRERRGGDSIAGDSIFERSASRAGGAHERSLSRNSGNTKQTETGLSDPEREELENKNAELRDSINAVKLQNQELQRELDTCMEDFEIAVQQKQEAETVAQQLHEELEAAEADLQAIQAERNEALSGQEQAEINLETLRKEAQGMIDGLENDIDQKEAELEQVQAELNDRTENFNALQTEMRELSEALVRLEDDQDAKLRRIQELEQELEDSNRELEEMEKGLVEANNKVNRLTVQQESSQGEIAFLREEQDGDKIKIGDLEAAIRNADDNLRDEKERVKDLEQTLVNERLQREFVAGKEKQEIQKFINELNREASGAKDEARKLRKSLTSREVEAAEWKERLMELENNLREALGDIHGTRSSLLKSIEKLQRELENTSRELESTREAAAEKDRRIKERDALLESSALESRKLADMLDKERQLHRNTKHQHETHLKSHSHTARTASQQETRIMELEAARQQDRKKLAALENSLKDQITERNNLLLNLWDRLSALCGTDWAHDNSLINGRALPSPESLSTMLPGFSKNLMAAVKMMESIIGSFKARIKTVERDLWKEYQSLEHNLDMRTKKLDRLETVVKSGVISAPGESKAEVSRLKEINRTLKSELTTLRNTNNKHPSSGRISPNDDFGSPSPSVPTGPRDKERSNTLTRHHSTSTVETIERASTSAGITNLKPPGTASGTDEANEERWIFRLRELERRLKAEREARLLDRSGARKRLQEGERREEELKAELDRERIRRETALH